MGACKVPDSRLSQPIGQSVRTLRARGQVLRNKIRFDYSQSAKDVYIAMPVASIAETQSLDMLSYVYGTRHRLSAIPSFIPDLTATIDPLWAPAYVSRCGLSRDRFRASRNNFAAFSISASGEATTTAVLFDAVSDFAVSNNRYMNLEEIFAPASTPYESPTDALARTLCGELRYRSLAKPHSYETVQTDVASIYKQWHDWIDSGEPLPQASKDVAEFTYAHNLVIAGRRFAISWTGYLGFVPNETRPGDLIAILPGGSVPYVLRQLPDASSSTDECHVGLQGHRYTFLGGAYLNGIMHGGAYDETKLQPITLV